MKYLFWVATGLLMLLAACDKSSVIKETGTLAFSADTVKFDSIFVNFKTPTGRLIARNRASEAVRVSRVWLEKGDASEFALIVDGVAGRDVRDVVIRGKDSLHVFIELKSQQRDAFVEEYIAFQIGSEVQRVLLRAWIVDAYYYRARVDRDLKFLPGSFAFGDTTLTPAKPIIIDGPLLVLPGKTLTIQAGTKLYFTSYKPELKDANGGLYYPLLAGLLVQGTLRVEGTRSNPVLMTSLRLEKPYEEKPGEWRGLWFFNSSQNSNIEHLLLKNAAIGIRIDSVTPSATPRLTMRYSEVRNMSQYGIQGVGFAGSNGNAPMLLMENCLVHSCKEQTLAIAGGGNYVVRNCTFANYGSNQYFSFLRNGAQCLVQNYFDTYYYPLAADFTNCIFWGDKEDEFAFDLAQPQTAKLRLTNCLYKFSDKSRTEYEKVYGDISGYFDNCLLNSNPQFRDPRAFDFRPQTGSPVVGAGKDLSAFFTFDFRHSMDTLRTVPFDIGAYKFVP